MKKILIASALPFLLYAIPPQWYATSSIESKEYEIVGYGVGASKDEAKQNAKSDIANSIRTNIQSSTNLNKSVENGNYNKTFNQNIKQSTNVVLTDIEEVKSSFIDGKYYIAMKYINLPLVKRIRLYFNDTKYIKKETNNYLLQTQLLKELKDEFGFYPKVTIERDNLIIKDKSFHIDKETLKKLFSEVNTKDISLKVPKKLKHDEFYFIDTKANTKGYLTIIMIEENGATSLLIDNVKLEKNQNYTFPNKDKYDGLQAYLNDGVTKAKDLILAVFCQNKKDFSYFDTISQGEENYALVYGKAIGLMSNCSVNSKKIEIRR